MIVRVGGVGVAGWHEGIEEKDVDHEMTGLKSDKLSFHRNRINYLSNCLRQ